MYNCTLQTPTNVIFVNYSICKCRLKKMLKLDENVDDSDRNLLTSSHPDSRKRKGDEIDDKGVKRRKDE